MAPRKKKTKPKKPVDPFSSLRWEDVENWAGNRIVARGQFYLESQAVEDLRRAEDRALVAWVLGSRRYATRVRIEGRKNLQSECTCPYWTTCKHAVAVVLGYLENIKNKTAIGRVEEDDPRLLQLDAIEEGFGELEEFDIEEYEEDWEEEEENVETGSRSSRPGQSRSSSLRAHLQKQTKAELVALVMELAEAHDEVLQSLEDRRNLASGKTDQILQTIRREIAALEEPVWEGDGYGVPAASTDRLEAALKALVEAGQADAAVRLGPELLAAGTRAVEYEHEGESGYAISACLNLLFQALDATALSPADRIEWALDMALADAYDLCDAGLGNFWKKGYARSDWSEVSDRLERRPEADEPTPREDDFSSHVSRDRIANWLIIALENAGRRKEIIPLCEREAPITFSYNRLVDRLMAGRRWEDARRWCRQGIKTVPSKYSGLQARLRRQLQTINQRSGNPLSGLAIQAEEFFAEPSLAGFQVLCRAARKARIGKGVEAWGRHYLETGRRPGAGRRRKSDPGMDWPLPACEVEVPAPPRTTEAPVTGVLIQLAIAEKKPNEVLKWYDHSSRKKGASWLYDFSHGNEVAMAVESPSGPGGGNLEGNRRETYRPGKGERLSGVGALSAQGQGCTHPEPSQGGMGRVPGRLETAEQPQASMPRGAAQVGERAPENHRQLARSEPLPLIQLRQVRTTRYRLRLRRKDIRNLAWVPLPLDSALVSYRFRQSLEVGVAVLHGVDMTTESAIGCLEQEHWLPRFLGHRHQAAIVLQRGQAFGVVIRRGGRWGIFPEGLLEIDAGNAGHPSLV